MLVEQMSVIISIGMMAFALSMDAFSVSLGLGMQNLRLRKIAKIGIVIGILHMALPFIGMIIGQYVSERMTLITELTGGIILVFIGAHMFFSALRVKKQVLFPQQEWKLLIIAFFVSIDSFPAGLSIGLVQANAYMIVMVFGLSAVIMSWIGMLIGKRVHGATGKYSEMLGGIILYFIGISLIFY